MIIKKTLYLKKYQTIAFLLENNEVVAPIYSTHGLPQYVTLAEAIEVGIKIGEKYEAINFIKDFFSEATELLTPKS